MHTAGTRPFGLQSDLLVLGLLALGTTLVFWMTDLDIRAAKLFFHPQHTTDPWYEGDYALWDFFYHAVPVISAAAGVGGVFVLLFGNFSQWLAKYRLHATFFVLTLVIGPGLIVNALFKDHWGRPRPRQVVELGGEMRYVPPLMIGAGGKSFPAGHSSVGFALACFWLMWRRRHPFAARIAFFTAIATGGLIGAGRMAAGGHFLSDVLWSGYLTIFSALLVYYVILRVPQREGPSPPAIGGAKLVWLNAGYGVLGAAVLAGSLFAFPVHENFTYQVDALGPQSPARVVELDVDQAKIHIELRQNSSAFLDLQGSVRGFGLPGNKVISRGEQLNAPVPVIKYKLVHKGIYSERDSTITVTLGTRQLERLVVRLTSGNITVTADKSVHHIPPLDLVTKKGRVTVPPSASLSN